MGDQHAHSQQGEGEAGTGICSGVDVMWSERIHGATGKGSLPEEAKRDGGQDGKAQVTQCDPPHPCCLHFRCV